VPGSRYDRFRRRVAPIALVLAIGLVVKVVLDQRHQTGVTVVIDFGGHGAEVRHLRADVFVDGAPLETYLESTYPAGAEGPATFEVRVPDGDALLRVDLSTTRGPRRIERRLTVVDGAKVHVDLGRDLDRPAP
jgi:hypothetical protein